jgi:pimeloyl-ACP methyl ester carboxylesterase
LAKLVIAAIAILIWAPCHGLPQSVGGQWTGGFWVNGNWVAVLVTFPRETEKVGATANVISPVWGGRENAINVTVENLKQTGGRLHLEIPTPTQKVILDGTRSNNTISGRFVYGESKGSFGLTHWGDVAPVDLPKYYGAYRAAPDRIVSVFRGWSYGRTLNYVDYKTGEVGTLWPVSDGEFFAGHGLGVSFPVTLRVSFNRDATGDVSSVRWHSSADETFTAQKLQLKEERFLVKNGDINIGGTLILPTTKGRHPVVIVTPGDYGTNRDQLRMWAHNFVSHDIAAVVLDSRGAGESTGPVNSSSFSDLANDVLAVVQQLKTRDDINNKQIGFFGFSNSCFFVSLAASRSPDVAFLIMQSFVGVPGWKQETFRAVTQLRVDGLPATDIERGREFMRLKFDVARTGKGWHELQSIIEKAGGERWLGYTAPPNDLDRLRQTYESIMTYDPVPALERLHIPILALWGGKDTFLPVPETVAAFKRAMAKSGNNNYTIKIYPNGSHSLLETATGSPSTGSKETNFSPGEWKLQTDWLRKHVIEVR